MMYGEYVLGWRRPVSVKNALFIVRLSDNIVRQTGAGQAAKNNAKRLKQIKFQ